MDGGATGVGESDGEGGWGRVMGGGGKREEKKWQEGDVMGLTHLSSSSPVSIHGSFMHIHFHS